MTVRAILRLEGATVFTAATGAFVVLNGPWWLYLVLILAPDLSMVGYLAGPVMGARTYNAVHTYPLPVALGAVGWWASSTVAILVALVWLAHVGADRAIGYGLKYPTGFADTHLSQI